MSQVAQDSYARFRELETGFKSVTGAVETEVSNIADVVGGLPGMMADEMLANQFLLTDATTELVNFMDAAISPAQERFNAQGFLASQELADGLNSGIPSVRAKAEEMRDAAVAKLAGAGWYDGGRNAGLAWSAGLRSAYGASYSAGVALASGAGLSLRGLSPPKEGPLSDIDVGGFNVGKAWADGLIRAASAAQDAGYGLAGAVNDALSGSFGAGSVGPLDIAAGSAYGAGTSGAGGVIEVHSHLHLDGRQIAETVDRHLYYMQPAGPSVLPRS